LSQLNAGSVRCICAWWQQTHIVAKKSWIYINDIDNGIASKILKFADDTKLYRQVRTAEDIAKVRNDLETLVGWSKEWLMLFHVEKCKVMHIGFGQDSKIYDGWSTITRGA
jgi:ribonuclease P/MRP protein subunit RPP40